MDKRLLTKILLYFTRNKGVRNLDNPILLETSTFWSLSIGELEQYKSYGFKIMISPYTFWELLCHLDKDWAQYKTQVCKSSKVKILDDPRAFIETELQYKVKRLNNRLPDNKLIPEIIECLRKSNSINDFYDSNFIDSMGNKRLIKECSSRVQEFLDNEAEKYSNFVKNIHDYLTKEKHILNSDINCHNAIMSLVEGAVVCAKKNSNQTKDISNRVIDKYYLYFGYIFERTKQLLNSNREQPERNDYEDCMICLHLSINKFLLFITMDKDLSEALINALKRLHRIGWLSNNYPRIIYKQNKNELRKFIMDISNK